MTTIVTTHTRNVSVLKHEPYVSANALKAAMLAIQESEYSFKGLVLAKTHKPDPYGTLIVQPVGKRGRICSCRTTTGCHKMTSRMQPVKGYVNKPGTIAACANVLDLKDMGDYMDYGQRKNLCLGDLITDAKLHWYVGLLEVLKWAACAECFFNTSSNVVHCKCGSFFRFVPMIECGCNL